MSEQEKMESYMQELARWTDENVIHPLYFGDSPEDPNARSLEDIADQVRFDIRLKMLESYRKGQQSMASQKPPRR